MTLSLPVGMDYKFRLKTNGLQVYTGSEVCTPLASGAGCAAQTITLNNLRQVSLALTGENGAPLANRPVYALSNHAYAGTQVTGADGKAVFTLPVSGTVGNNTANLSYTFSAYSAGGFPVSSAACAPFQDSATPGCGSAAIAFQALSPVTVSVTGGTASTRVFVYSGADYAGKAYTGINGVTDSSGSATFNLPNGHYWFGALENGAYSMQMDSQVCALPGCSAASLALGTVAGGTVQIAYSYDKLSRLTAADYTYGKSSSGNNDLFFHYTFDAVGNRISQTTPNGTVNYSYDASNRLTSVNGQSYQWDPNGNLLNDGTTTYTYDTSNRLVGLNKGTQNIVYKYSGLGDRLQQIENGTTTNYTLDTNSGLTQVLDDGTNKYLYGNGRISQVATTQTSYFLPDSMGSVRQMVDATGAMQVAESYRCNGLSSDPTECGSDQTTQTGVSVVLAKSYDPYGNVINESGTGKTIFGYDGEQQDSLVYLRTRYYDSSVGRFTSQDTWMGNPTQPMSYNKWLFVNANPINIADPSGKSPQLPQEFQSCISSSKLVGVDQTLRNDVCGMIGELEDDNYLTRIPFEDQIPQDGGYRSPKTAHKFSTAYHILHDFVSVDDLRRTPKDVDGNVWYKKEWDEFYCASQQKYTDPQVGFWSLGYLDYLIKKNASDITENHLSGMISGYVYTLYGAIRDVPYALEGYSVDNSARLPNSSLPGVSNHVKGLAVDVSERVPSNIIIIWTREGFSEIDRIAQRYNLYRPLNNKYYAPYTNDEIPEWWHFELIGNILK